MKQGKKATQMAKKLFKVSQVDGQLHPETVKKIVDRLIETKPRGFLALISAYWRLVRLDVESNRARIHSAVELEDSVKAQVVSDLEKKYGSQIQAEFGTDPDLLGGMKIQVGSDVWDGSVKNRIARLEEKFN